MGLSGVVYQVETGSSVPAALFHRDTKQQILDCIGIPVLGPWAPPMVQVGSGNRAVFSKEGPLRQPRDVM